MIEVSRSILRSNEVDVEVKIMFKFYEYSWI